MFEDQRDRPESGDSRIVFAFQNEMMAFDWPPHRSGWVIANSERPIIFDTVEQALASIVPDPPNWPQPQASPKVLELEQELLALRRQLKQTARNTTAMIWVAGNGAVVLYLSDEDMSYYDQCHINWMPFDTEDVVEEQERQQALVDVMAGCGTDKPREVGKRKWREAVACGARIIVAGIVE